MIVLEVVPFRGIGETFTNIYNNAVGIELWLEAGDVTHAHELTGLIDELLTGVLDEETRVLGNGRVTDALEELDALLSLQLLQVSVLLDEVLLLSRDTLILQSERCGEIAFLHVLAHLWVHRVRFVLGRDGAVGDLLQADTGTAGGSHGLLFVGEKGSSFGLFHFIFLFNNGLTTILLGLLNVLPIWICITNYPAQFRNHIEFTGAYLDFTLSCCICARCVSNFDLCLLIAEDVSSHGCDRDVRMCLHDFNIIVEVDWCIRLYSQILCIRLSYCQMLAHIQVVRQEFVFLGVYHWECMDRDENLVPVAVYADGIVEILLLIIRGELYVDVLSNTAGDHAFLVVLDLEIGCLWG